MRALLPVIAVLLSLQLPGCLSNERDPEPIEPFVFKTAGEMAECAVAADLDSAELASALVGMWEWKYESCFWTPESASGTRHAGVVLEFRRNGTLRLHEGDSLSATTRWRLEGPVMAEWTQSVEMDTPYVHYAGGIATLCGNTVLFYDSYVDGCDQWFHRLSR